MRVLYDYQAFDMQPHGGVSRCFAELYQRLPSTIEAKIGVQETNNIYLQQLGFHKQRSLYENFFIPGKSLAKDLVYKLYYNFYYHQYSRWDRWPAHNRFYTIKLLKEGNFDILHPTFFDDYFLDYLGNKPFVLTIHDMIPELYPQFYPQDNFQIVKKKILIPKANHIITVSNHTKEDLIRLFHISEDKISVIHHGASTKPYICSQDNLFDFPYILYVGDRQFYKNFGWFSKACLPILNKYKDIKVVCTGKPFDSQEIEFFKDNRVEDRFVHKFVTSNQMMFDAYHNALVFVYPSAYEGFGIPILEAYKANCPVMLNEASCFPEIAGDAAIYFSIDESGSNFANQFEKFMSLSDVQRKDLLKKQQERLKRYTWQEAARKLTAVYEKIL